MHAPSPQAAPTRRRVLTAAAAFVLLFAGTVFAQAVPSPVALPTAPVVAGPGDGDPASETNVVDSNRAAQSGCPVLFLFAALPTG